MPETRKVRTTMQPSQELEVTPQEYTDLKRQGLLLDEAEADSTTKTQQAAKAAQSKEG